ncbi:MAG: hypothetical protein AAF363_15785 [Bacteroidota bacterium]
MKNLTNISIQNGVTTVVVSSVGTLVGYHLAKKLDNDKTILYTTLGGAIGSIIGLIIESE